LANNNKEIKRDEISEKKRFVSPFLRRRALAGKAPRFEKGKGSGAKEDPSPASTLKIIIIHQLSKCQRKISASFDY